MNFITVTITSPLTPINPSNKPLVGIQDEILTLEMAQGEKILDLKQGLVV